MANEMTAPVVEPLPGSETPQVTPQVTPREGTPPEEEVTEGELPEELIRIPAVQAVMAGSPPAVSMPLKNADNREEVQVIAENKAALEAAGMGFYRSISGDLGVMFNGLRIHPEDIQAADKAGKLQAVAPDFDAINREVAQSGANHPILKADRPPAATPIAASAATAPQAASGKLSLVPPAPASVARKLAAQRIMNLQAGAPTSGASPGAGRLLNQVMKPAV